MIQSLLLKMLKMYMHVCVLFLYKCIIVIVCKFEGERESGEKEGRRGRGDREKEGQISSRERERAICHGRSSFITDLQA